MPLYIRALLAFAGFSFALIGCLSVATFPEAVHTPLFAHASHIVRAGYIISAFIMLFAGCGVCALACRDEPRRDPIAQLRSRCRLRCRLARLRRALLHSLAVLSICLAALSIGAASAATGMLAADPSDYHGYRAALHAGDYCYAAFGLLCHANTFRKR